MNAGVCTFLQQLSNKNFPDLARLLADQFVQNLSNFLCVQNLRPRKNQMTFATKNVKLERQQ